MQTRAAASIPEKPATSSAGLSAWRRKPALLPDSRHKIASGPLSASEPEVAVVVL
jgi:hypothetical protein